MAINNFVNDISFKLNIRRNKTLNQLHRYVQSITKKSFRFQIKMDLSYQLKTRESHCAKKRTFMFLHPKMLWECFW